MDGSTVHPGGDRDIAVGDVLEGKYEILGELGAGAMGVIYAGRHLALGKRVAIKTLRAEIAKESELISRFEQEARAASAIGHPNIVEVFDLGSTAAGLRFMVMELLDGENLGDILEREGMLPVARAAALAAQVLSALEATHRRGIVHRDLKPDNIFVIAGDGGSELVKLLDFGISKVLVVGADPEITGVAATAKMTRFGTVLGTPLYMAPEQARGLPDLDHRVDLWAVGCVLYEMLCGCTPFHGENYNQILAAILEGSFSPPRQLRPSLPPAVEAVILRALSPRPSERFAAAAEMRAALLAAASGADAAPVAEGPPASGAGSGLAVAAGAPDDDAQLSSALDGLEKRLRVSAELDAAPAPAPVRPDAAPAAAVSPPPLDAFAPPDALDEELDLEVNEVAVRSGPVTARTVAAAAKASTPRPRRARRGSIRLAGVLRATAVVAAVAAAALAGYRYHTLGYLLSPPAPTTAAVHFQVEPREAAITVDGAPLAANPIDARGGVPIVVGARAPGRLAVERTVVPEAGTAPVIALRLPHAMPPLPPTPAGPAEAVTGPPAAATLAEVDDALAKLAQYAACLEAMGEPLTRGRDAYAAATPGDRITEARPPVVEELPVAAMSECRLRIGNARDLSPTIPPLDDAGGAYLAALIELAALATRMSEYYDSGEYQRDRLRLARRQHRALRDTFEAAHQAHGVLARSVAGARGAWLRVELDAVAASEGEGAHWHLRRLLLASQEWVAAELSGGAAAERAAAREALAGAAAAATELAAADPDRLAAIGGAVVVLEAVGAVLERAHAAERSDPEQLRSLHNRAVEAFNAVVL